MDVEADQNPIVYPVVFKGTAKEYFRIWIVNTLLTILTLGIYSAWAKVRKRKYFYRNTYIADDSFDYHADPKKILIGRILIAVLFVAYTYGPLLSPVVGIAAFLIFISAFPWLIVRGAIFNYRNTSYRNVRFGFEKNYKKSYKNYFTAALATVFSVMLLFPFALYKHYSFMLNNISLGQKKLKFGSNASAFFSIIYGSLAYYLVLVIPLAFLIIFIGAKAGFESAQVFLSVSIVYIGMSVIYGYQKAKISNELASESTLSDIGFNSHLKVSSLTWIYITNVLGVICTLGFATPWATIRTLRYRLENTQVVASPASLNQFIAHQDQAEGHIADASADFWDIDLGL